MISAPAVPRLCVRKGFLVPQVINLSRFWSKLPLDSDGLMGEGPGLCIEVSAMNRVRC